MKRTILIITGILLVIFGGYSFWRFRSAITSKPELKTSEVKRGTLRISFTIDGKTSIDRRDLKFTVNGKITQIAVKEGQTVKRGQYLAGLDTSDVRKNLEKDLKDYLITRNNFDQTTKVTYPAGAPNDTIGRILQNTQYTLDKSVIDVELRDIALKESYLYSPIDGVVSVINAKEGETASTQNATAIMTVTRPDSLAFEAYAEDTEVMKLSKDQRTQVKIDAIPSITFPAAVEFISNLATIDQNGLSTYKIRALLTDSKSFQLLDGMSGQIEFITKEKPNVLTIPNNAVVRRDKSSFVSVIRNGKTTEASVETGFTDGKNVEIISGLSEGDRVVIL